MSIADFYSPERAAHYAERMFKRRVEGWGDETRALEDVAGWCRLSARSLKRIIKRETKVIGVETLGRIHQAYVNFNLRLIAELKHELKMEEEIYGHAALADLINEVEALEAKASAHLIPREGTQEGRKRR
ncbi:hypothetical protein ACLE20_13310 [Rhizobium sp. YIM 134829]|uniref:hypothetical protein n=1 Tax=Rhizobium sp. YIM 134829 TaxID=3390453 RepID=UPI00397E4F64